MLDLVTAQVPVPIMVGMLLLVKVVVMVSVPVRIMIIILVIINVIHLVLARNRRSPWLFFAIDGSDEGDERNSQNAKRGLLSIVS